MLIVWGRRLYGKTDSVPGVFYVSTQFFHIMYIPLIPLESFVVLSDRAMPMESTFSWKSVLAGWLMIPAALVAVFVPIIVLTTASRSSLSDWVTMLLLEAAALAVLLGPRFIKPGYARAFAIAQQVGLYQYEWDALNAVYGRTVESSVIDS